MSTHPFEKQPAIHFTGERFIPEEAPEDSHLAREHRARYDFAMRFVLSDDIVLDCASGAGYGSYALASKAQAVTGVDISADAIDHAAETYQATNLHYRTGDAEHLSDFADGTFTLVTSFETIEHIRDQRAYLKSIRRVLKRGGTFIMSMPNREFYSMAGLPAGVVNPFHINERSIDELESLLREVFSTYEMYGQNYYNPPRSGRAAQSLLLLANRLPLYRWMRTFVPVRLRNRVVEGIGAAPKSDIAPLDLSKGIPTNILAVCR